MIGPATYGDKFMKLAYDKPLLWLAGNRLYRLGGTSIAE